MLVACVVLAGCGGATRTAPVPALPFAADTLRAQLVRAGVTHWFIYVPPPAGPWAIHALIVDRGEGDACYSALAVKGSEGAVGREKTSAILEQLRNSADLVGGVNADFFLFTPPGVPTNALVSRGRVVTGPSNQPVLAFDSLGAPHLVTLHVEGSVVISGARRAIVAWNRTAPTDIALFDESWGRTTDTLSNAVEVVLTGRSTSRVTAVDTSTTGVVIPRGGAVLVARGSQARAELLALEVGDTLRASVSLLPFHPAEAVGGRPLLLRDSTIAAEVDTEGQPGFATGRHPRTAVGIARGGRRLLLVVVDGRQKPYSDGMTLRELATLMRALGARDAINLDGGGSTTLVYADPDASAAGTRGALRIANRPSDATGERPVGDALAIVHGCAR
jgi:hypothetical protein